MDKEQFDIDNIEFKAISKGLGFHHSVKDKSEVKQEISKLNDNCLNELVNQRVTAAE